MKARVIEPEILDSVSGVEARCNLWDLERLNRWFGGHSIAKGLLAELRPGTRFSLLDVGAASGDFGRAFAGRYPGATVVNVDMAARNLARAPTPKLVADAMHLPFGDRSFDYVFCSFFLHHFNDAEVVRLLRRFGAIARRAVFLVDLERSTMAHRFLGATRWLFRWHPVTMHDGPVSVRAAFRAPELLRLAEQAGLGPASVRRHRPWCRLSLVSRRGETLA